MRSSVVRRAGAAVRPLLVGAALSIVAFAAGSLVLYQARGALTAAGGLVGTFAAALAAGVWAGAPAADGQRAPAARWVFAGICLGLAGVFATLWSVYDGDRFGEPGRAAALLFLVGVPVYAIGLLLPALIGWQGEVMGDDDDAAADQAPAAPASVATVLAGAAIGAAAAGLFLLPMMNPGPLLLATAAFVTFPLFFPQAGGGASDETVLLDEETPFGTLRVTEIVFPGKRQPERRLYQNDEIESGELTRSGAPTFAYIAAAERVLSDLAAPRQRYLFLGGGAYTLPRRVAERDPAAAITVVELDPEVTRAAYKFFGLRPEHGVRSLHGDGRMVASTLPAGEWDRVFIDVYDGTETVPYHLVTAEAMSAIARLLAPGGVLGMNVIGVADGDGDRRFWSTVRTVREAFPRVRLYHHLGRDYPDRQNFLLFASADDDAALPGAAGSFELWPEAEWPLAGTAVFRDRYPATDDAPREKVLRPV